LYGKLCTLKSKEHPKVKVPGTLGYCPKKLACWGGGFVGCDATEGRLEVSTNRSNLAGDPIGGRRPIVINNATVAQGRRRLLKA